ncbi:bifunctional diguanylate cyclase/phosphodiesterase [Cellulomonas sp. SLBN-39]|uniref:putative bifunctional diguanylate cyclase/phosphodiesterase n=1 Tax=Cellulomonas sp. SLBN-39 TaxID=2768446 RepID=UPI001151B63C|nr:bifunctional diguanylate cyclase/phosphodiesterase [Cellulomonas sp. SLBN-39]TQL02171.1 diguanylate cyclase (GGDEF)-like protein [Cellulomonas sp. SLBN-39]
MLEPAAWLVASAVAAVVLHRRARSGGLDVVVWQWLWRAALVVVAMLAVETVIAATGGPLALSGAVLGVGSVLTTLAVYRGLVHWNRDVTLTAAPGDWSNGVSSLLTGVALAEVIGARVSPPGADPWALHGMAVQVGALVVVLGTATTILVISGLARRALPAVLIAVVWVVVVVDGWSEVRALLTEGSSERLVLAAAWGGLAVCAAAISTVRVSADQRRDASSVATAVGAVVVLFASLVLVVVDAAVPGGPSPVTFTLSLLAGLIAATRLTRLVGELADLADSRVEARTDMLTGVANRRALVEAVEATYALESSTSLLVIDLDGFKNVNDRLGHAGGDEVIRQIADRLRRHLPADALLARFGGDEFAIVLRGTGLDDATRTAHDVLALLAVPVEVRAQRLGLGASVGVASNELADHGTDLVRRADTAMYMAKRAGGGVRTYDAAVDDEVQRRHLLLEDLRGVLLDEPGAARGTLVVHYQPQVDVVTDAVVGAEALVRWRHPVLGLLPPMEFLPLAEEAGLMPALTAHVLRTAARDAARWPEHVRLAVNVSATCLSHPGLLGAVEQALATSDLAADRLVVEVTETSLMRDPEVAGDTMRRLRERDVVVSIDDYGTGYASLAYLHDLPAHELKLDRSFTVRLATDARTRAIVSGTIAIAHRLGVEVLAEGVEDTPTLEVLRQLGCDRWQGFLRAPAVPVDDLVAGFTATPAVPAPRTGESALQQRA